MVTLCPADLLMLKPSQAPLWKEVPRVAVCDPAGSVTVTDSRRPVVSQSTA